MRLLVCVLISLHMLVPIAVWAQVVVKTPLSYSMHEYSIALGTALLGGMASWWMKVRRGELVAWNLSSLIGELCVSAFAGLLTFWLCEYFALNPLLTAPIIGMSGLAGAKGLTWVESIGQRMIEKKLGLDPVSSVLPKDEP